MNKSLICTTALIAAAIAIGTWYSASRIATCDGNNSQITAACLPQAWDTEKVNLVPQYDPDSYVSDPTADSIFAVSKVKR